MIDAIENEMSRLLNGLTRHLHDARLGEIHLISFLCESCDIQNQAKNQKNSSHIKSILKNYFVFFDITLRLYAGIFIS